MRGAEIQILGREKGDMRKETEERLAAYAAVLRAFEAKKRAWELHRESPLWERVMAAVRALVKHHKALDAYYAAVLVEKGAEAA